MPRTERRLPVGRRWVACAVTMLAAAALNAQRDGATEPAAGTEAIAQASAVIERLHDAFVAAAASGQDRDARYAELLPVVRATHALELIARLTIRRQWRDLDEPARERFVAAFERLSVMTYAGRFAGVSADTFRIVGGETLDDGRIEVSAEIARAENPPVTLEYVLQHIGEGWRIVNILADGVSDLALKRAQYQRVLRNGGTIDDVIAEIETETAAL